MAAKKKAAVKKAAVKKQAAKSTPRPKVNRKATAAPDASSVSNVATLSGIAAELATAAKVTPAAGEAFHGKDGFADRLVDHLSKIDQADFDKLHAVGRKWFDDSVDFINTSKYDEIPALDGYTPAGDGSSGRTSASAAENASAAANATPAGGAPAAAGAAPAPAAAEAPKEKKKRTPAAPKEKKERGPRLGILIGDMVVKNNKLTFEQLCERLDVEGKKGGKKVAHDEGSYIYARFEEAKHIVGAQAAK